MRIKEIFEGKTLRVKYRYGHDITDITIIENPSMQQTLVAYDRTAQKYQEPYLRGLCFRNEKIYVWDGFVATHDDVQSELFPDEPPHSSDITLFEVDKNGIKISRQGDYDLPSCAFAKTILKAIVYSDNYAGSSPAEFY